MSRKQRKKQPAPTPRQKVHFEDRAVTPGVLPGTTWYSRSYAGVPVTYDSALTLSTYWACVRAIASPLGYMSCHVRQTLAKGGSKIMDTHPADWVLSHQANPETTSFTFRETTTAWALTNGNGYAEIETDNAGRLAWLWQITPDRVQPARVRETGELVYDIANRGAPNVVLPASKVFHLKGLGYDGVIGYSVVDYARQSIALGLATEKFGAEFFGNGLHPSGVVEMPGHLSNDAVVRLQKSVHEQLKLAHDVLILEDGSKWNGVSIPPENAQYLETRQFQGPEMCRWFGVPPHKIFDLSRATFCLPGDAQVFTEFGPKNIADIHVGEKVWSHNPAAPGSPWVLSAVEKSGCTGEDEILTIKCRNRTLRCNAKHRVAIRKAIYIPYEGGKGRYLVSDGKPLRREWVMNWVEAWELQPGDQLLGVDELPELGSDSCPTREHVSPEFMEVLGLLLGDGFYARNAANGTGSTVGISHGEHDTYLPHYIAAIEKEFRAYAGPYGRTNGETAPLRAVRRDKNTTVFYAGHAYDELAECGMVGTATTKRVPRWVFALTRKLKLAFLRGYLDADGTVNDKGQIRYVSVNKDLLDDVRHLCVSAGITVGNLFSHEIESTFDGSRIYRHRLYGFICTDVEHNAQIGSYTDLYNERIAARRRALKQRTCTVYPNEQKRFWCGEGLFATRIQSIERSQVHEPVYDLTVSGTHCFVSDLLLVHNSNIEHLAIEYVTDALVPWVERWEQEADLKLFGANRSRFYTKFNVTALLRGDVQSRYAAYAVGRQWGWLSVNDIRQLEDMNPLPPHIGDTYLVPMNMVALSLDPKAAPFAPGQPPASPKEPPPQPPDDTANLISQLSEGQRLLVQAMVKLLERDVSPTAPPQVTVQQAPMNLRFDMAAPSIAFTPPEVHNDFHMVMPERAVTVQVDGTTVNMPEQRVQVDNHIDVPERPVQVNVDGTTVNMPEQRIQVETNIDVPEKPVNVTVAGSTINLPEHKINVDTHVDVPEQPVHVAVAGPTVHLPEQHIHVDVDVPEKPVQVNVAGATINMPEQKVQLDNHIDNYIPERQVNVNVEGAQVSVADNSQVTVRNEVDVPERMMSLHVDAPQVIIPEREVHVHNALAQSVEVPERAVQVHLDGPQITVPERTVQIDNRVDVPERQVHVNVDNPITLPDQTVHIDNRVDLPESQVTVRVDSPITVPEREVRVENQVTLPEHQLTLQQSGPQIIVPEREIHTHVNLPESQVNIQMEGPRVEVPEREVHVHSQVALPEQHVTVHNEAPQVHVPEREVHIENRIEAPEQTIAVHTGAPQVIVPEREIVIQTTNTFSEPPTPPAPSVQVHVEAPVQPAPLQDIHVHVEVPERAVAIENRIDATPPVTPVQVLNDIHVEAPEQTIVVQNTNEIQPPEQPIQVHVEAPQVVIPERDVTVNVANAPQVLLPEPQVNVTVEGPTIQVPEREVAVHVGQDDLRPTPVKFRDKVIRGLNKEIVKVEREVLATRMLPANHVLQFTERIIRDKDQEIVEIIREATGEQPVRKD